MTSRWITCRPRTCSPNPSIDYDEATFQVTQLAPTHETIDLLMRTFPYVQKGGRVFSFWRGFRDDDTLGLWVHAFYDVVYFMVTLEGYNRRAQAPGAPKKNQ